MQDIIYIFVTFGLVVVDIVVALLYADAIQMLLEKDRSAGREKRYPTILKKAN